MPKAKQVHLTTEQILEQSRRQAEFLDKMKFVKEVFYPALCKATTSIEDASQNLTILNSEMMESFLTDMKTKKFGELNMEIKLSQDDPKYAELKDLLHLFDDMSIFEAKTYIEGMKAELEVFKADFWKNKPLEELPTKWLDEIGK